MTGVTKQRGAQFAIADEAGFREGIVGVLALTPGVIVFAAAFAVSGRAAGFTPIEVVALSMLIFAGSAQVSIVALAAVGASPLIIVATAAALNVRHVMYGLSLSRFFGSLPPRLRLPIAFVLTDEAFGITVREYARGRGTPGVALGSGIGLYVIYVLSTLLGVFAGGAMPFPEAVDFGFIFPLMFLALLMPLIRSADHLAMAVVAAMLAVAAGAIFPGGVAVLLVILVTAMGWAGLRRNARWNET